MRLSEAQTCELLRVHGTYITDACDNCGRLLGPVRFTRQGQTGVWCSRACRDGVDHSPTLCRGCGTSLGGKKRGTIYCGRTCRMRTVRKEFRNCTKIVNTPIQKTGDAAAISAFGYGDSRKGQDVNEQQRIGVNQDCENTIR
jgi:hypothetical protein